MTSHTKPSPLISAVELTSRTDDFVVIDCRFSLAASAAGGTAYAEGHIPGALYVDLERDLSDPVGAHGGRHPLPQARSFCQHMAQLGVGANTAVVAYDDSRLAFAARLWWMLRALGYRRVQVLDGGLEAWLAGGGQMDTAVPETQPVTAHDALEYAGCVDIEGVRAALERGALLLDSREEKRYQGLEEPIDPVAGHIPGAVNFPWQDVTDATGLALNEELQRQRWSALEDNPELVVYCGSGVTACVNLLSLEIAGRADAQLYGGSWSDWCSYLENSD
jgi:thiosulfate/3-mercaptopyruvate sulfurtransferase